MVPVLAAAVVDHDVVASGISLQGFVRGDLTPSPGTRVRVMVALLDPDQLAAIHDSEGVGTGRYDVVEWPGVEIAGTGRRLDVLAYACCRPPFVSPEVGRRWRWRRSPPPGAGSPPSTRRTCWATSCGRRAWPARRPTWRACGAGDERRGPGARPDLG